MNVIKEVFNIVFIVIYVFILLKCIKIIFLWNIWRIEISVWYVVLGWNICVIFVVMCWVIL